MNTLLHGARTLIVVPLITGMLLLGFSMVTPARTFAQDSSVAAADVSPPTIPYLADIVVTTTDPNGSVVSYLLPAANDDVDGAVIPVCVPGPGAFFPVGATPIVCSATDNAGNFSGQVVAFNIVVVYQAPPTEVPTQVPTEAPTEVPTELPTEVPTEEPTEEPTDVPTEEPTETPEETATETPTDTPALTETPAATEPSEGPATESPTETATPTASETPSATPSESPTPSPSPTPVVTPDALPLPAVLPPPANPIYGSGPIDSLSLIWGGLDFPVSQEYGHTDFSLAQATLYLYGIDLGLDGRAHPGLDIGMPAGTYIYSPVNGTVVVSGGVPYYTYYGNGEPGVGELSIVTDGGDEVILGHMAAIAVGAGQRVTTGQFVGLSGGENGDHLHLEARVGGFLAVDPRQSFLVDSIAAYGIGEFSADPGDADHPSVPPDLAAELSTPEGEGIAVIDQPAESTAAEPSQQAAETGAAGSTDPGAGSGSLLDQLLFEADSPYGGAKTELVGEFLDTRSVTADDGSSPG